MKTEEIRQAISADKVTLYKGTYKAYKGFYYRHGKTSSDLVHKIQSEIPNAQILSHNEVWKVFKGGAPVDKQSHWIVEFKIIEK